MTPNRARCTLRFAPEAVAALITLVTVTALALAPRLASAQRLFRSDTVLNITITTDLRPLIRERDSLKLEKHAGVFSYADSTGATVRLPVTLQARGHWRRQARNCEFPPIRLEFKSDSVRGSLLSGLKSLKITTNCRPGNAEYEQYVLQEYLVYRAFAALTDTSLHTRLARITYRDTLAKEKPITVWAFFLEDMDDLAQRMKRKEFKAMSAVFEDLEQEPLRLVSVFEYFAGSLDWSVSALHNIALLSDTAVRIIPVAYDFDFTGAVNTRYSVPDARLRVNRVTDRLYRGVCMKPEEFKATIDHFRAKRADIDGLFAKIPQINADRAKRMQGFFNDFWKRTDDTRSLQREFDADCQKIGN